MREEPRATRPPEALFLGATLGGLSVAMAFQHWVIHRQVILPALAVSDVVFPWMWASLFVPELIVVFVAGWRLRGWTSIVGYGAAATLHRVLWEYGLARAGEPGHAERLYRPAEFAFSIPLVAVGYLVAFWLSSESGHEAGPEPAGDA